jgi:hypothetical protein
MPAPLNVLILGASYGSLLATKLLMAGHNAHLVCRRQTADLINTAGTRVRIPVKGRDGLIEIASRSLAGTLSASPPAEVDVTRFDLVALAMQEPQYSEGDVRALLQRIGVAGVPCLSLMNMPPKPYLARLRGVFVHGLADCYADATAWAPFNPEVVTLCSPDPQAFRPADEPANVLQVRLATNFKAARFHSDAHTAMLHRLDADIEAARFDDGQGTLLEIPVKLKVFESLYVPLAKWAMLVAGNYRCVGDAGMRPIMEAVHANIDDTRSVYTWVTDLCVAMGADAADMVPFEKYAVAAKSLASPSSVARALAGGATRIERVDRLVQRIALQKGQRNAVLDETVARVNGWLARNQSQVA